MFWFSNEISCFTLLKISRSEYSSPSAVPQTALVQITLVSTFAHLSSYLPLRASVHPWSIIAARLSLHLQAIYPWPVCPCTICMRPNLSFIHSRWASLCARGSSDWWSADLPRGAFYNSNCSKPNGSASPFGEAQLNDNKFRSAEMARGSRSRRNVPPSTVGPSEPEQPVSPEGTPATSGVGPSDAPAPDAPVLAPVPATASTDGLFQQFMKAYLENQNQALPPAPIQAEFREQPLKARFPDLYYGNSHLDCYRFCQQCEDHFETAGANGPNRIPFAASFLHGAVAQRWHQHKRRSAEEAPITWAEFKSFLRTNLGDDRAFADSICSKFRWDSQYQAESVLDWAAHLEYLQSILLEYTHPGPRENL